MKKERLIQIVQNPNFIPGIYNYCDRWCERCPFTSRCATFAIGEKQSSSSEDRDIDNARFWQNLHDVFRLTLDMINDMAEEQGIDLAALDLQAEAETERQLGEAARDHDCVRAAQRYSRMVEAWFDLTGDLFDQKEDDLRLEARLDLPGADPFREAAGLKDAVEIVRWYQDQIYVKLARAVQGDLQGTPEMLKDYPKDSDGSAKVALIAIDRSIAAWGALRRHFPDQGDRTLDVLVELERLRRRTEEVFPNARSFVRPGFDDKQIEGKGE